MFFEDKEFNPFMGCAWHGMASTISTATISITRAWLPRRRAYLRAATRDGRPIGYRPVPPGTPRWGRAWKKATAKWYHHAASIGVSGSNYANRKNYLDLDPTYKDQLGRPLLRLTYNFVENDYKVMEYTAMLRQDRARNEPHSRWGSRRMRRGDYDIVPYQSTHNTGGTIMGTDPKTSVVNRYLQAWDADNLFIMGASTFPQQPAYNPTGPVGALAYWSAEAITTTYLQEPRCRWYMRKTARQSGASCATIQVDHNSRGCSSRLFVAAVHARRRPMPNMARSLFQGCIACHNERPDALGPSLKGVYAQGCGARRFPLLECNDAGEPGLERGQSARVHPDPQGKVKGNRMPYGGLTNPKDVDDIVAYLKTLEIAGPYSRLDLVLKGRRAVEMAGGIV